MNNTTLTFNNGTTMTTAATGTVSSVATGNGLSGGTITSTGTLVVACPSAGSVGSYTIAHKPAGGGIATGDNINAAFLYFAIGRSDGWTYGGNQPSGTWKNMSDTMYNGDYGLFCRVS
jgi:hypothetical protein